MKLHIGKFPIIPATLAHLCRLIKFNNVFSCTFQCTLGKSLYYPYTFSVHTPAKIYSVRFRSRSRSNVNKYFKSNILRQPFG